MNGVVSLFSETLNKWLEDKAPRLGAALAYYAAFSIAPLLIIVLAVVDFFYRGDTLAQVKLQLASLFGANAADAIVATIKGAQSSGAGLRATVFSIIMLLIGATGVFAQLQDAMNTIWGVAPKRRRFWVESLRLRALSFALVLGMCALLLASLTLSAALAAIGSYFQSVVPFTGMAWRVVDFLLSFSLSTVLFAMIYKILPDVEISWSDVWIGAATTAVLFAIGKFALSAYLGRNTFASAYGAAGSFLVLLVWVYYSSQVIFFGAEFTRVYTRRYGTHVRASRGAVFLGEEARIRQGIPHTRTIEEAQEDTKAA